MAQVTVTIDDKQFRMACEDGQEAHLEGLAAHIDSRIKTMRESFGEIGDLRLTVMAALMVCDEYLEEKRRAEALELAATRDRGARNEAAESVTQRDTALAHAIDGLTQRVERITRVLVEPRNET
jgi:cell division protein ZapA